MITAVVLGMLFGFYKAVTQVRLFEAFGRIQVRTGSSNDFKLDATTVFDDDPQRKMTTEVAILTSDTLMASVGRDLNLANNPDFLGAKGPVPHRNMDDPGRTPGRGHAAAEWAESDAGRQNRHHPDRVQQPECEAFGGRGQQGHFGTIRSGATRPRFASTQRVSQWLGSQLTDLKDQVEASQAQVMDLQRKLGTLGFDSTKNQISTTLDDLARASAQARLARILAESRYRLLNGMDPSAMDSSLDAGPGPQQTELNTLRRGTGHGAGGVRESGRDRRAEQSAGEARRRRALRHSSNKSTRSRTGCWRQSKESYLLAKANEDQTGAALEEQKADAYKLRDDLVEYTIRQRDFESNRTLYEGLLQKLRTAGVQAGLESLEIDIVDQAAVPVSPIVQPQSTIVLTWAGLGLVLGVLLAFVLESLDTGLRSIQEIEAVTELPSLAIVPRAKRASPDEIAAMTTVERNINVLTQPKSQFTEAFRSLRTALMLSTVGHEPKLILFTSATPSEGKTTAASNLAVILAQRGTRVLLVDADLRRPNLHHRFGLSGKLGLSTVLSGQTRLEDAVQPIAEVPGLDILPSGPVPPFPTEMLSSATMIELMRYAGEIYSHIVMDSPPILSVTDGVLLSRQVDAVVLVVRHGKSSKQVVRRARDLLVRSGAPLAGVMLNVVDLNAPEYYGYYGYAGYSGYSYSSLDPAGWDANAPSKGRKRSSSSSAKTRDDQ